MPRSRETVMTRVSFKQADVVRAVKSAQAAGLTVHVVEVVTPDGVTIRVSGPHCEESKTLAPADDLDAELAEFEARHAR